MNIKIRTASTHDLALILDSFLKGRLTFDQYFKEQASLERDILLAEYDNALAGYVTLKSNSEYESFNIKGIPEIKDLVC